MVWAIDPHLRCEAVSEGSALVVEVVRETARAPLSDDVALTRFSTGTTHAFETRGTPVTIRTSGPATSSHQPPEVGASAG